MKPTIDPVSKGAEEARQQLPAILAAAAAGHTTIITRHGQEVAAVVPVTEVNRAKPVSLLALAGTGRRLWGVDSSKTIAEVLTGPLRAGEEALAKRYRAVLEAWRVVDCTCDIAESAARLRGRYSLKLPDAIQLASALAINADALVTHDGNFGNVQGMQILG